MEDEPLKPLGKIQFPMPIALNVAELAEVLGLHHFNPLSEGNKTPECLLDSNVPVIKFHKLFCPTENKQHDSVESPPFPAQSTVWIRPLYIGVESKLSLQELTALLKKSEPDNLSGHVALEQTETTINIREALTQKDLTPEHVKLLRHILKAIEPAGSHIPSDETACRLIVEGEKVMFELAEDFLDVGDIVK